LYDEHRENAWGTTDLNASSCTFNLHKIQVFVLCAYDFLLWFPPLPIHLLSQARVGWTRMINLSMTQCHGFVSIFFSLQNVYHNVFMYLLTIGTLDSI